jgi:hypothetical protein
MAKFLSTTGTNYHLAVSNLKCNTLTEGNVHTWERDTNTCSQKTE